MILVIVDMGNNNVGPGIWGPRLKYHDVDPSDVLDHHFLFSRIGPGESPEVESLRTLENIELKELHGLVVNLSDGCKDDLSKVAESMLRKPFVPQAFVHKSDKEGRSFTSSFGKWTGKRRPDDYKHEPGDKHWALIQKQLCIEVNPTPYELFHDLFKRIVLLQLIIKSRDENDLPAMWQHFHDVVNARDFAIGNWHDAFRDELNTAISSKSVQHRLAGKLETFQYLSEQLYGLTKVVFPSSQPAETSVDKVEELSQMLRQWKDLAQQAEGN